MPDTISIRGDRAVERALDRASKRLTSAQLSDVTFAVGEAIRTHMVKNKLSGQVLRVVTGKLRSGFSTKKGPGLGRSTLGTRTVYAAVHEFGFSGVVSARSRTGRAYRRRMNLRARRYFRSSIRETRQQQIRAAERAVERLVGGAG